MEKHFVKQGDFHRFVTAARTVNQARREVEALGFRFYGRTFQQPFGEDIWLDANNHLAFAQWRRDEEFDDTFYYAFSSKPVFGERVKWIINEPVVGAVARPPVKVGDIVSAVRKDQLAAHEGVVGKVALAVVEHIDGTIMTVVWRGRNANKDFANHSVIATEDATLVLSV